MTWLSAYDLLIFRKVNGFAGDARMDVLMLVLSSAWLWWGVAFLTLAIALYQHQTRLRNTLLVVALAVGLADLINFNVLKPRFGRERPCWTLENVVIVDGHCGGDYGFPSNHAANGSAAAVVIGLRHAGFRRKSVQNDRVKWSRAKLWSVLLLCTAAVDFSRVYLGVHFPADVLGGALFGALIGGLIVWIQSSFFEKEKAAS